MATGMGRPAKACAVEPGSTPGTLKGPAAAPVPVLQQLLAWCRLWPWPPRARADATHAQAAAEQAGLLAELELLQLAQTLQEQAHSHGGYEGESFDLMLCIADRLEQHHGWDPEQCDAWLERMGVWDWED